MAAGIRDPTGRATNSGSCEELSPTLQAPCEAAQLEVFAQHTNTQLHLEAIIDNTLHSFSHFAKACV